MANRLSVCVLLISSGTGSEVKMKMPSRNGKILRHSFIVLPLMIIAFLGLGFAIFKVAFLAVLSAMFHRPMLYEFANDYRGWAVVKYDDPSCPPLRHENIYVIIPISSAGKGCTSSPLQEGWRVHLYEYVRGPKVVKKLGDSPFGYYIVEEHTEAFFVGSKQELGRSWAQEPK